MFLPLFLEYYTTLVSLTLTSTVELHNKIELMSARIHELEALLRARGQTSDDPPPSSSGTTSLTSQSSAQKMPSDLTRASASSRVPEPDSFVDAFGI